MKISHGRSTVMKSLKTYPLVSVLLSRSGHLFQCTLQLKYAKVLSSHTSIIAALHGMAWPNGLVRNFKNFKIVLSELSPNLAMIQVPDIFLTCLVGTIYRLEGLNKRLNRPFAQWCHFTATTRILFVFPFTFTFCNPKLAQESKTLKDSGHSSKMMSSCKWPI